MYVCIVTGTRTTLIITVVDLDLDLKRSFMSMCSSSFKRYARLSES